MKSSSLQLRKISLIELLLGIQDEKMFSKVESTIQKTMKAAKPGDVILSKSEMLERAALSNRQIKKGQVVDQKKLEQLSKNW